MKKKRFLAVLLSAVIVAGIALPAVPAQKVYAEETTKVLDMDFDDGTLKDTAGTVTEAKAELAEPVYTEGHDGTGKALDLNGSILNLGNSGKLQPADMTLSFWAKAPEGGYGDGEVTFFWFKKASAYNADGWYLTSGKDMPLYFAVGTSPYCGGVKSSTMDRNTFFPAGEWVHVIITYDSDTHTLQCYRNGKQIKTDMTYGSASDIKETDCTKYVGRQGYSNANGLKGAIDDIEIYNKAMSAKEIGDLVGFTEQDLVDEDADNLRVASKVTSDFTVPVEGNNGSVITWKSDKDAVQIDENGNVSVTRGTEDVVVTLTATAVLGGSKAERTFKVTVVKENQPAESLSKLSADEIKNVGGTIGKRLDDAVDNYAMDYLYGQKLNAYLNEYKNHSHSGWSWLEGEQPGKWLESMANYKWKNDPEIKAAIKDVVGRLAASQTVEDKSKSGYNQFGGYLGNGTESIRNKVPVKGMDPYEMYSTLNGLINVYSKYQEDDPELADQAINCAIKLADYLVATIGDENTKVCYQDGTESTLYKKEFWPLAITNGVTIAGHDVHQGWEGALIIDPMMLLSQTVANIKGQESKSVVYSEWVDWVISNIDKWASSYKGYGDTPYADLDKVASGEMGIDQIQHYVHAHTFQMTFLGFLKKYQETGDETYLRKVTGAWDDIISRQVYITGTTSVGEHYEAGHNLPNTGSVGETCATNSWTLLNNNLFELTGSAKYQQVVEDVIYNHMFATSTIDGDGYSYHRPLNGSTERFYTGPDCCSSSGMRMQSYLPYYIYSKSDSEVYVNQFIESEADIQLADGKNMHLKQTSNYPTDDEINIEVMADTTADTLNIRVPDWVESPVIKVNGENVKDVNPDEYVSLKVKAGDKIQIVYPSEPEWVAGDNSNEGSWAIKEGPMVYCVDAAFMTKEESQEAYGADVAPVSAAAVTGAEDGKKVELVKEIKLNGDQYFGNGYMIKMTTPNGERNLAIVPYANVGQWYRYGEDAPGKYGSNYNSATRYSYAVWMSSGVNDYPEAPEEESEPVVHYDFDSVDGTTVKDVSGNGKDATAVGNVSYDTGKLGKGISLNGTDAYVKLPEDVIYGLYNMSISAWINPEQVVNWARVFDFGNGEASPPYPNLFLTVHNSSGNTRLAYEDGTNSHVDTAAFATNTWTHITVTISGSKAVLYVNGNKAAENTSFHMLPFQISEMTSNYIGKSNYTADSLFKGDIDDFRIYNRALGSDEIAMLAKGEEPERAIQTVEQPADVETVEGTAPVLPEKVNVTYTNGTQGKESVVWNEIPAEQYAKAGTFTVNGTVGNTTVKIKVTVKEAEKGLPYKDVQKDNPAHWFYDAVKYNYEAGTMTGLKKDEFGPYQTLARAQFAVILWRLENSPETEFKQVFSDITDDESTAWYAPAVIWANKEKIVTGYSNGKFGPSDFITREQMALMMYRYAENYKKYDTSDSEKLDKFADAQMVSSYAKEAMEWAVGSKIITGKDNETKLDPQGIATRAECATIIMRFMEKYSDK